MTSKTPMAKQKEVNEFIGHKMKLLGIRARDPNYPMHHIIEWDDVNGMPILPDSDEQLAQLVLAALDEPDPSQR